MDSKKGPFSWLKSLLSKEESNEKKYRYLLIVLLIGAAIMLISNLFLDRETATTGIPVMGNGGDKSNTEVFGQSKSTHKEMLSVYEDHFETQLKDALEGIIGVGDVTVVVNIDATEKRVLEKNTSIRSQTTDEVDREGGTRKVQDESQDEQIVIIREGEKEVPIILETKKPKIRGVLVVAKGADDIQVKKMILESVTKLLDVPVHRVSVMPKK